MFVKRGDSGSVVRSVQEMLKMLGFSVKKKKEGQITFVPIEVDGKFGPDTESTVLDFQSSEGLLRDGIVGPVTMRRLAIRIFLSTGRPFKRSGEKMRAEIWMISL